MLFSVVLEKLHDPVFAPLLDRRGESLLLVGVGFLQVGLTYVGLPAWTCPIKATLGIPCPGCGLSSAISLLLHAQWHAALEKHAFAPVFLLGFVIMALVSLLPAQMRGRVIAWVASFEQKTAMVMILLVSFNVYWVLRLFHWM